MRLFSVSYVQRDRRSAGLIGHIRLTITLFQGARIIFVPRGLHNQLTRSVGGRGPIRRTSQEGASSVPPRICSSISFVSCLIASLGSLEGVLRRSVCSCGRSFIGGLKDTNKLLRNLSRCLNQVEKRKGVQIRNRTSDYSQLE